MEEEESGRAAYITKGSNLGVFNGNERECSVISGGNVRKSENGNVLSLHNYFTKVFRIVQNQDIPHK